MAYDQHYEVIEKLTDRQKEILRLVAQHFIRKEIAGRLGISGHTVKAHIDEARKRLGVANERQAARLLAEYEAQTGIPLNRQYLEERIAETPAEAQLSGHEQALYIPDPAARSHDHSIRRVEAHLAFTGREQQGALRRRDDRDLESHSQDHEFREADLYYGHRDGMVDGPKRLFGWRLDELSPLQCGALILTITVGLGFMAVALLATSATTFQAIQGLIG